MTYSSGAAAALGSLLRKAQEDRQAGPHLIPQSAEESSPIRQQVQGPIVAPESVGSEKVVSMKGEMQPIQEGATQAPINVDGNVSPLVVPPVVPPMAGVEGGASAPVTPSSLARSVTPSGIGSPLLPSSMKGTSAKVAPSVLEKSVSQPAQQLQPSQEALSKAYKNISTGTVTQGQPTLNRTQKASSLGGLVSGASQVARGILSAPMLISDKILKLMKNTSIRGLSAGKTVKG